jgi:hypothetical protein
MPDASRADAPDDDAGDAADDAVTNDAADVTDDAASDEVPAPDPDAPDPDAPGLPPTQHVDALFAVARLLCGPTDAADLVVAA